MARNPPRGGGRGNDDGWRPPMRGGRTVRRGGRGRGRGRHETVGRGGRGVGLPQPQPPAPAAAAAAAAVPFATDPGNVLMRALNFVGFSNRRLQNISAALKNTRFRSFFGMGAIGVAILFDRICVDEPASELRMLLMALNWLKLYDPEGVLAARWNMSEESLRVHIRTYVARVAALEGSLIQWGGFGDETFIVSVDGTHCPVMEPRVDPGSKWYSHKFNGAGVTYELAIAIRSNNLVWINGPYPASTVDITMFRSKPDQANSLMSRIPEGKRAVGDSGYAGEPEKVSISRPEDDPQMKRFKARVKSRQETFNGRLKGFRVLQIPFRHGSKNHRNPFVACCVCMQIEIQNGNGLFEV